MYINLLRNALVLFTIGLLNFVGLIVYNMFLCRCRFLWDDSSTFFYILYSSFMRPVNYGIWKSTAPNSYDFMKHSYNTKYIKLDLISLKNHEQLMLKCLLLSINDIFLLVLSSVWNSSYRYKTKCITITMLILRFKAYNLNITRK